MAKVGDLTRDELDQYVMEKLVFDDEELSPILKGHLVIERILEALISAKLVHAERLFSDRIVSFDMKLNIAGAMGLLPDHLYNAAKGLNKIRNKYAHNPDFRVSMKDLASLKTDWEHIQNKAFSLAKKKSSAEAARISVIFLSWAFQHVLHSSKN